MGDERRHIDYGARLDRAILAGDFDFSRAGEDVIDFVLGVGLLGYFGAGGVAVEAEAKSWDAEELPVDLGRS
jgi:hypothetical protein